MIVPSLRSPFELRAPKIEAFTLAQTHVITPYSYLGEGWLIWYWIGWHYNKHHPILLGTDELFLFIVFYYFHIKTIVAPVTCARWHIVIIIKIILNLFYSSIISHNRIPYLFANWYSCLQLMNPCAIAYREPLMYIIP